MSDFKVKIFPILFPLGALPHTLRSKIIPQAPPLLQLVYF